MYAGEDGEVCVELGYVGKELPASHAVQPERSKAGGWPSWFGEAPVDMSDLICRLCGRSLYLVTQIYAPTHVQRSLCVFGCNQAACSLRPEGWRVLRTQAPQHAEPAGHSIDPAPKTASTNKAVGAAGVSPPKPPLAVPPAAEPAADAWGASADLSWDAAPSDGDGWGAEEGEWGAEVNPGGQGGKATADIEALLDEREKRSSEIQGGRTAADAGGFTPSMAETRRGGGGDGQGSAVESAGPGPGAGSPNVPAVGGAGAERRRPCFPAKAVSFMPEPWGAQVSGVEDKDMQNRLRRYREQEEDRGLVAALDQALGLNDDGGAGSNRRGAGGAGAAGIGEKYERTPARAKAVMRFADRVARSPHQALRYAYGGQPLWSASDPPTEDAPPCACGATRVFEMQLMPALLLQLNVNDLAERETNGRQVDKGKTRGADGSRSAARTEHGINGDEIRKDSTAPPTATARENGGSPARQIDPKGIRQEGVGKEREWPGVRGKEDDEEGEEEAGSPKMPTPSAEERERLRTLGMDWGVVAVWSCPRSCEVSNEECVVVQLPV